MNHLSQASSRFILPTFASAALFFGVPIEAAGYDDHPEVKKVKVKDHKVKVKTVGGKAKIKHKANGKQKVKVKGWNGELASAIAADAAYGAPETCGK